VNIAKLLCRAESLALQCNDEDPQGSVPGR
jgi:hypothetical protein